MPKPIASEVDAHLPLRPVWHQVLLAVATGHAHGYAIRKAVAERSDGKIELWPTTLYGALRQLMDNALLAEESDPDEARGKRTFTLTALGEAVLDAETRRLEELVRLARGRALVDS